MLTDCSRDCTNHRTPNRRQLSAPDLQLLAQLVSDASGVTSDTRGSPARSASVHASGGGRRGDRRGRRDAASGDEEGGGPGARVRMARSKSMDVSEAG
jgi:hypothetical protein